MKKALRLLALAALLLPGALGAEDDSPATREIRYGKQYATIGTFDGWSFWVGYDANFSESYAPEGEAYAWVVHFAPEAVYLSLQKSKNVYSGVDVNAGFNMFYGLVKSPDGDTISRQYIADLSARTFAVSAFDTSPAAVGPLSNLSAGISSSTTFYAEGGGGTMARAVQYGAGMTVSYALVPNPLPFSVSLDTESGVEAGFYPIAAWETGEADTPRRAVIEGLRTLASGKGKSFVDINNAFAAGRMLAVLESFPLNKKIDALVNAAEGDSEVDRLIAEVGEWDRSGDTKKLPEATRPEVPPARMYALMKPLQAAVTAAFESGYKRGYDSTKRNDALYADCLSTLRARAGTKLKVEVTRDEIVGLMPELKSANLEGIKVVFDNPPETYIASQKTETAIAFRNGKAVFEITMASPTAALLGVRIDKSPRTKNKTLELCRRLVVFE